MVKEANTKVSTQQTSQDNPLADFGPNEWIVDEMYQRYLADPSSVGSVTACASTIVEMFPDLA